MTRYIDADALNMYERLKSYYGDAWRDAQEEIDSAPTIDAVPVIRCKDCKYRITANCERFGIKRYTQSDSFCSWAEPKGDKDDS